MVRVYTTGTTILKYNVREIEVLVYTCLLGTTAVFDYHVHFTL